MTAERDGCGCLIAWESPLPNGHRAGVTVEDCGKHLDLGFYENDYIEVQRPTPTTEEQT